MAKKGTTSDCQLIQHCHGLGLDFDIISASIVCKKIRLLSGYKIPASHHFHSASQGRKLGALCSSEHPSSKFYLVCVGQGEVDSAEMVEREAKRLEVLKRRQEREMGQLVQFELMRKAMQVNQPYMPPCPFSTAWSQHIVPSEVQAIWAPGSADSDAFSGIISVLHREPRLLEGAGERARQAHLCVAKLPGHEAHVCVCLWECARTRRRRSWRAWRLAARSSGARARRPMRSGASSSTNASSAARRRMPSARKRWPLFVHNACNTHHPAAHAIHAACTQDIEAQASVLESQGSFLSTVTCTVDS